MFLKLKYPEKLIDSTVTLPKTQILRFPRPKPKLYCANRQPPLRTTLPFKDQKSADIVYRNLRDLKRKIYCVLQPVFTNRKIAKDLKVAKTEPSLANHQCVVYGFKCNLCDVNYIGTQAATSTSTLRSINNL